MRLLESLQRGLEQLYRIDTQLSVADFLLSADARDAAGVPRAAREQLLLREQDGELELGLFVDETVLASLAAHDPRRRLDDRNLADFLLTLEGVSHFVLVAWRARAQRPVSALELELQAEVDKWITCLLTLTLQGERAPHLRQRLFESFELEPGLDARERERYLVANSNARAYAGVLDGRYVARGDLLGLTAELRRFYRMSGQEKLSHIARAA